VFDEFGGVSQHILGIQKFSCHKVTVVPSKSARLVLSKAARVGNILVGIKFAGLDLRKIGRTRYQRLTKIFLNKIHLNSYDVVHSHVDPWFTNLCLSSRTNTCKWVHTYHTLYFEEDYPNGLQTWQEEINRALIGVASKAHIRISVSKWLHDYLSEAHSIQTEIIPNGVDLESCDNASPDRFRKKYRLFGDFVLFIGYMQPIKNPRLFVELAAQIPEVKFVIIGRNLDEINLRKEYRVSIPRNLALQGEMKHRDVLDAMSACKVYVSTSKREGIPTALLEAMGMSKPVVVPANSGCKEVVHSNDYGFLYEPDSLEDLVEQTRQALISKHVGGRARERVLQNYDWKILAKRIDSLYDSCR